MNLRNLAITGVIILALLAGYAALSQGGAMNGVTGQPAGKPEAISYSQLVQRVNAGEQADEIVLAAKREHRVDQVVADPGFLLLDLEAVGEEPNESSFTRCNLV